MGEEYQLGGGDKCSTVAQPPLFLKYIHPCAKYKKTHNCISGSQVSITDSIGLFPTHRASIWRKQKGHKHTNLSQRAATATAAAAVAHSLVPQSVEETQAQHQHLIHHRQEGRNWKKQKIRNQHSCDAELRQNNGTSRSWAGRLMAYPFFMVPNRQNYIAGSSSTKPHFIGRFTFKVQPSFLPSEQIYFPI